MKRILVTGGAGFLGSNLCHRLVRDRNNEVIALDNLFTGRLENIETLMGESNFQFIKADVCDEIDLPVDQIYNAACPASPVAYQKSPTSTTKTCVLGILNMLELSCVPLLAKDREGLENIVFAGGVCAVNPEPLADFIDFFSLP